MSTRRRPRRSAAQATAGAAAPAVADIPVDPALDDLLDPHSSSDDDHPGEDDYATQDDDDEDDYRTNSRGGQQHGHQQSQQQQQQQGQQGQASQQGKKRSTGVGSRTAATAWAPEGMRFCTGCRKNQNEADFENNRKMCFRHKGKKKRPRGSEAPPSHPDPSPVGVLERTLRAASDADGVSKYEAAVMLDQLPGQEYVELELRLPYTVVGEERAAPKMDTAESMRRARAKARPLVELIHQSTGYSFVYKDCRTGTKQKYAYSLRYLCSQRSDQDGTKRRSAALAAERKAAKAAEARRIAEGGAPLDNTNAEAGPSDAAQQQQQEMQQVEDADVQALQALIAEANQQPHHLQHGNVGEIYVDPMLNGEGGISVGGGSDQGDLEVDFEVNSGRKNDDDEGSSVEGRGRRGRKKNKGKAVVLPVVLPPLNLPRDSASGSGSPAPQTPGSISASLPADNHPSESASKDKLIRKMDRFDCRGSLIINILQDDVTAYFTITHHLHHAEYVDVVGNRLRGAKFHPLPVNLSATIEEPKGDIEMGGEGDTWLERAETTFVGLLELVRDLKTKKGGGEEEAGQELYERSEGARGYRVSVLEALAKGGLGIPRPIPEGKAKKAAAKGAGKGKGKKRAVEAVEDVQDGGAAREAPGPSLNADLNTDADLSAAATASTSAGLHHLPVDLNVDVGDGEGTMRELRMEDMVQGLDVGALSQLGHLHSLDDHHHHHHGHHHLSANGLRHQLDGENGDLTVDYSALQAHQFGVSGEAESWMDPRLG